MKWSMRQFANIENYALPKERDNLTSSEWLQILTKYVIELTKKIKFLCKLIGCDAQEGWKIHFFGVA